MELSPVHFIGSKRERERYYLLPGMGKRAYRAKLKSMVLWGVLVGLLTASLFGATLYAVNHIWIGRPLGIWP